MNPDQLNSQLYVTQSPHITFFGKGMSWKKYQVFQKETMSFEIDAQELIVDLTYGDVINNVWLDDLTNFHSAEFWIGQLPCKRSQELPPSQCWHRVDKQFLDMYKQMYGLKRVFLDQGTDTYFMYPFTNYVHLRLRFIRPTKCTLYWDVYHMDNIRNWHGEPNYERYDLQNLEQIQYFSVQKKEFKLDNTEWYDWHKSFLLICHHMFLPRHIYKHIWSYGQPKISNFRVPLEFGGVCAELWWTGDTPILGAKIKSGKTTIVDQPMDYFVYGQLDRPGIVENVGVYSFRLSHNAVGHIEWKEANGSMHLEMAKVPVKSHHVTVYSRTSKIVHVEHREIVRYPKMKLADYDVYRGNRLPRPYAPYERDHMEDKFASMIMKFADGGEWYPATAADVWHEIQEMFVKRLYS